jgi:two-component system response regulator FlrC
VPRILVVDDDEDVRDFLEDALDLAGHDVSSARDGKEAVAMLQSRSFHVVVTDLNMPRMGGMELVRWIKEEQPEVECIVLTAHGSVSNAVEAMKLGALDYLQKPLDSPKELRLVVDRAFERRSMRDRAEIAGSPDVPTLSWGAASMERVVATLRKVSRTDATVLLTGESGTGKEVTARAIHAWSPRSKGPFVAINCATLSEGLLEGELFGHEAGAFTGATTTRRGRLELAEGGTFFLDEIAEMNPELQAKLLRVLQERKFERVGGRQEIDLDVRFVAATNRDLEVQMQEGRFREDLYHRIAVFPVHLPPLRERREDIAPLADALLGKVAKDLGRPDLSLSDAARTALTNAPWSGNVRELANTLERAAILADSDEIQPDDLMLRGAGPGRATPSAAAATGGAAPTMEEAERQAIRAALDLHDGNRRKAAEHLGIGLRTLYDKIKKYGL